MNEKILVVGGAGYIGSHVVLGLIDNGYQVTVFDNLSRGQKSIAEAPIIVGNLCSKADLNNLFNFNEFDLIMHFAALAYVGESVVDPELYYQNNVVGTLNLLEAIRKQSFMPIVFSSTCATYGEPELVPISETHKQNPINPYGLSKLWIEQSLQDYAKAYGQKSISLRYFNAAGCDSLGRAGEFHDPETHLIPLILNEALRLKNGGHEQDTTLCIFGLDFPTLDGSCVRDFIHVSDISYAHILAAKRLLDKKVIGAEFYNLANGNGFSVLEVIEACKRVTGQKITYKIEKRREGDPAQLIGNADLANQILNWHPRYTNLDSIIKTAWDYLNKTTAEIKK